MPTFSCASSVLAPRCGRHHHLRQGAQGEIRGRRFGFVNVQRRAAHLAALDGGVEIGFVDDAAAGAIENAHALFHFGEGGGVDHALGFLGHRHVDGDEIRPAINVIDVFLQIHLQGLGAGQGEIRIVGQHLHAEGQGALGHFAADAAHAEDAEGFVVKLGALKFLPAPFALFHGDMGLRNFAGQRHEHGKGQFGRGNGVAARRVHHHDAPLRGGIDIHVVHADAGAADDAQIAARLR